MQEIWSGRVDFQSKEFPADHSQALHDIVVYLGKGRYNAQEMPSARQTLIYPSFGKVDTRCDGYLDFLLGGRGFEFLCLYREDPLVVVKDRLGSSLLCLSLRLLVRDVALQLL